MITVDQIISTCNDYKSNQILVAPILDLSVLISAKESLKIPDQDEILCLVNLTFFRSFKDAIAFCLSGIYHKNIGNDASHMPWELFGSLEFQFNDSFFSKTILFSNGKSWSISNGGDATAINLLLRNLHNCHIAFAKTVVDFRWFVAVDGKQYGPYQDSKMKSMLTKGEIDPASVLVWREGFSEWLNCSNVPELQMTTKDRFISQPPPISTNIKTSNTLKFSDTHIEPLNKESEKSEKQDELLLVDINNASLDDLLYLPYFTLLSANNVIQERENRLGFHSVDEIGEFLALNPHMLDKIRSRIRFEPMVGKGLSTTAKRRVIEF